MLRILCVGDSITYGKWDTEAGGWVGRLRRHIDEKYNLGEMHNAQVYNLGIPGETTRRLIHRVDNELDMRLSSNVTDKNIIIYQIGTNDANHNNAFHNEQVPKEEFLSNIDRLVEDANEYTKNIIFLGLTPIFEESLWKCIPRFKDKFFAKDLHEYAESLKNHCKEKDYKYIHNYSLLKEENFFDGIHPDSEGHELIFQAVLHDLKRWNLLDA